MSAVLEHKPEVFRSPNYYDSRLQTNSAKSWVFFALDVIDPTRKSELSWLRAGGEETSCPCLKAYGLGFVPRGLAAMLELGGDPMPSRHLGELTVTAWRGGLATDKHTASHDFAMIPVYPGDGLRLLKRYARNDGGGAKGLDELEVLRGLEWEECHTGNKDGILDVVELAQYGDGMSQTLKGLEDQIRFAKVDDSRIDYGKLREQELKLCEDARHWAMRKIAIAHAQLKMGHIGEWQGGWSYSYSPATEMLIEQLELKRQDQPIQEMADMVTAILAKGAPQSTAMSAVDMDLWERKMDEKLALVQAADKAEIARLQALLEPKPAEVFKCEACGQEAQSLAGLKAHQRARHAEE